MAKANEKETDDLLGTIRGKDEQIKVSFTEEFVICISMCILYTGVGRGACMGVGCVCVCVCSWIGVWWVLMKPGYHVDVCVVKECMGILVCRDGGVVCVCGGGGGRLLCVEWKLFPNNDLCLQLHKNKIQRNVLGLFN